jgi:hypothetical protein
MFFDYLIRGWDRKDNPGNYLFTKDSGRVIAIDHGWCFRTMDFYHDIIGNATMHLCKGRVADYLPDLATYKKLKTISDEAISDAFDGWLSRRQIAQVIHRKDHFIERVEELVKSSGGEEKIFLQNKL